MERTSPQSMGKTKLHGGFATTTDGGLLEASYAVRRRFAHLQATRAGQLDRESHQPLTGLVALMILSKSAASTPSVQQDLSDTSSSTAVLCFSIGPSTDEGKARLAGPSRLSFPQIVPRAVNRFLASSFSAVPLTSRVLRLDCSIN
jgi:hypothetical protein